LLAVITSIVTGSAAGVLAAVISDHSPPAALVTGDPVGALLAVLMQRQDAAWTCGGTAPLTVDSDARTP
jgi:hypothetical protein